MKRLIVILCMTTFLLTVIHAQSENCFKLSSINRTNTKIQKVNQTIHKHLSFSPFKSAKEISGISIDAEISRLNPDFLVRILLKDKKGIEYLVLEAYKEIFDEDRFALSDYAEETIMLNGVQPDSIKVYVINATVSIKDIKIAYPESLQNKEISTKQIEKIRTQQAEVIAQRINNYNRAHDKLWVAGVTSLSKKSYEVKKRILNMADNGNTGGFEYYIGGIFEVGNVTSPIADLYPSPYIDNFDWRYRHGKTDNYWITSIKDQGESGFCVFFSIVGCTEAIANLYYNANINLDLSEMELGWCSGVPSPYMGVTHDENDYPFEYMVNHGICSESSYPFIDDPNEYCRSGNINVNELVKITNYHYVDNIENVIKDSLIHCGPLVAGIHANNIYHAMVLVGYGTIKEGDVINQIVNNNCVPLPTIMAGDPRIGKTYWIYKDSYLDDYDEITHNPSDGYAYVMYENCNQIGDINTIKTPIIIPGYTSNNIVCEDVDGDGYYFWGIGPKPANCPSGVHDTPDGDDSNSLLGPMDQFGYLTDLSNLSSQTVISGNTTYSTNMSMSNNTVVIADAILTITGTVTMASGVKLTVHYNGTIVVDGGTLQNADLALNSGCHVIVKNGGSIIMQSGKHFDAPLGSTVDIISGNIQ